MSHHSHVVLGLCEVAFLYIQFLHICMTALQMDIVTCDMKDNSGPLKLCTHYWDRGPEVLDTCQDEW